MVQVRCRLDHGSWSEWSDAAFKRVPNCKPQKIFHLLQLPFDHGGVKNVFFFFFFKALKKGNSFWIFASTLVALPFMAVMCILVMKWN